MSNRAVAVLVGVAVVLVLLAFFGNRGPDSAGTEAGRLFLPGLEATLNDTERVTLTKAGNEIVATLQRVDDGWVVAERDNYPADFEKIRASLRTLAEAEILEAKTSNSQRYDRLGVEDVESATAGGVAVTLHGAGDPVTIVVGNADGDYRYVRRAADATSYLIDRDPEIGTTTADWLDTEIVNISGDRIREVTVSHPDGENVRVTKAEPNQANFSVEAVPEDRELLYESVANVMGNVLESLRMEDVARGGGGEDGTRVEFRTFDGLVIAVSAFQRDDESWVSFQASHDPSGQPPQPADSQNEPEEQGAADVEREAADINRRLGGWQYKIPTFKYEQMTRRMDDLLQSEPES